MTSCLDNITKILDFRNLDNNWNNTGAKKPDDYFLVEAIDLLKKFTSVPQPEVFLTASDSIQFEWESQSYYLEYELSEDGLRMYETIENKEIINRDLNPCEYEAINFITRCELDKWYSNEEDEI